MESTMHPDFGSSTAFLLTCYCSQIHLTPQTPMSVQRVPCTSSALHGPLETSTPGGRLPLHAPKQPRSLERHDFGHCGLTQEHIYANW